MSVHIYVQTPQKATSIMYKCSNQPKNKKCVYHRDSLCVIHFTEAISMMHTYLNHTLIIINISSSVSNLAGMVLILNNNLIIIYNNINN